MKLPRRIAITSFLFLAVLWFVLFLSDAGNFWHGGTVVGLVVIEAIATFGILVFVDVVRSDTSQLMKAVLAIIAAPLLLFTASSLFYAAKYLFAA